MNIRAQLAGLGAATLLTLLAPPSSAQLQGYQLTSAVPADFYLVTGSRQSPDKAFIDEHWARVGKAFLDSGIREDLMGMVTSQADPQAMQMVTGVVQTMTGLVEAVDWSSLGEEVIYGQRLAVPVFDGNNLQIGAPDMVVLFKTDPDKTEAVFNSLLALETGVFDQIKAFTGQEVKLQRVQDHALQLAVLDFKQFSPQAPDYPIALGFQSGVVVLTTGAGVSANVAALLAGEGRSIASTPRFQAAFKGLPAAKDGFEYTDMPNLNASLNKMIGSIQTMMAAELDSHEVTGSEGGMQPMQGGVSHIIDQVAAMVLEATSLTESSATVHHTEGFSVFSDSRVALATGADENRFYPLIAAARPVGDFAKFLPASTSSYSVSGGTDLAAVYAFALDTVKGFGPFGSELLKKWDAIQAESGFSMQRDLISWIDGETIKADFKIGDKDAWVTRVKVKDEAIAREKLSMVLGMVPDLFAKLTEEQPMLMMLGITVQPSHDARYADFSELTVGMGSEPMLLGVQDGWLLVASSGDALELTAAVAAGTAPNVRENEALMADSVMVDGAVNTASFADYTGVADGIADGIMGVTMMGGMITGMIEDPKGREVASTMMRMLGKLAPVIREIDFFRSSSSVSSFDGKAWHARSVTNYAAPRPAEPASRPMGE